MKTWIALFLGVAAICAACFLAYPLIKRQAMLDLNGMLPAMEASVKVHTYNATGSGVHIGGGDIITAAHVVGDAEQVQIEYFGGGITKAVVVWSDREFDIALIRVERKRWEQMAPLACAPNFVGQRGMVVGNPMDVSFVFTRVEIVGAARKEGPWGWVHPVDGTIIYGQSGGGVIDFFGKTIGIAVGLMPTPYGIAAFGYIVPAEKICELMEARA